MQIQSYGGYFGLHVAVQQGSPALFKCVISTAPVTDMSLIGAYALVPRVYPPVNPPISHLPQISSSLSLQTPS